MSWKLTLAKKKWMMSFSRAPLEPWKFTEVDSVDPLIDHHVRNDSHCLWDWQRVRSQDDLMPV